MFPELFRLPGIDYPIASYGLLLATAMIVALYTATRLARRDGLDGDRAYSIGMATLGASFVGSKLLLIATDSQFHSLDRLMSREFWGSAGVYYGGFLAAFFGSIFFAWAYGQNWWRIADAFAPAIAIGQSIGRLGCFAAGCCWGRACDLPWAVTFPQAGNDVTGVPAGVPLHPVQLYESAASLAIFGILMWLRGRKLFTGQIVLAYLMLYSVTRFTIELWRDDPRGDVGGLTTMTGLSTSQLISVACFLSGAILMLVFWLRSRNGQPATAAETGEAQTI